MELTVDLAARDRLADLLERFTREEMKTLEFSEAASKFVASTDPTVQLLADELSFEFCEEFGEDRPFEVSKEGWDYLQRLLVLLRSDAELVVETHWHWSATQLIALMCLLVFGASWLEFGNGRPLLAISASLGVVSMLIAWIRGRQQRWTPANPATSPFANTAELLAVRRTLVGFRKTRYPVHLRIRRFPRPPVATEVLTRLVLSALWLVFAPLPLLVQSFPSPETRVRVMPG